MYKRLLVPLDGSELAEQVLAHALAQAERFESEIVLLKVLEPLPEATGASPGAIRAAEEVSARHAREYLDQVATRVREQGISAKAVLLEGKAHAEIVRYAAEEEVDLIVISSRGQSGWSRWLLGSVTDRVVRGATVPVLLVQCQAACEE